MKLILKDGKEFRASFEIEERVKADKPIFVLMTKYECNREYDSLEVTEFETYSTALAYMYKYAFEFVRDFTHIKSEEIL